MQCKEYIAFLQKYTSSKYRRIIFNLDILARKIKLETKKQRNKETKKQRNKGYIRIEREEYENDDGEKSKRSEKAQYFP